MKKKEKAFIQSAGEDRKSPYRKPCMQVMEVEPSQLMIASPIVSTFTFDNTEEVDEYYGVRERRGTWGNLWE